MFTQDDREKALAARRARPTKKEQMEPFAATFAGLRKEAPRWALTLIDAAEEGSVTAALKVKCLDCSGWERKEVRDCTVAGCPLYPVRPYQDAKGRNANDP